MGINLLALIGWVWYVWDVVHQHVLVYRMHLVLGDRRDW